MYDEIYFSFFFLSCFLFLLLCLSLTKYKWNINGERVTHLQHYLCISKRIWHFISLFFSFTVHYHYTKQKRQKPKPLTRLYCLRTYTSHICDTPTLIIQILFIHLSSFGVSWFFYDIINDKFCGIPEHIGLSHLQICVHKERIGP